RRPPHPGEGRRGAGPLRVPPPGRSDGRADLGGVPPRVGHDLLFQPSPGNEPGGLAARLIDYCTIFTLTMGSPKAPYSRSHSARYISGPRAVSMSPRSSTCFQPNHSRRIPTTWSFAA